MPGGSQVAIEVRLATKRPKWAARHRLERILPRCALAVNGEYVETAEQALEDGDEVALLPPMSGG